MGEILRVTSGPGTGVSPKLLHEPPPTLQERELYWVCPEQSVDRAYEMPAKSQHV